MNQNFDPYYKWLGIPPKDQPPHHYRLLGIELFEADSEVIDAASNRLMAYLHDLAAGDEEGHSQRLLNEISIARTTLLNKSEKKKYDSELRGTLKTAKVIPVPPQNPVPVPPAPPKASPPVVAPASDSSKPEPPPVVGQVAGQDVRQPPTGGKPAENGVFPGIDTDRKKSKKAKKKSNKIEWSAKTTKIPAHPLLEQRNINMVRKNGMELGIPE